ncbi:type II toxin-antitoxin system RelE/ParE family toxin [Sphingobacterium sp. SGG-5]|uniref:type II toxin-antitoxin system RelE/ParE family toxin n=1 Tax=Sphingobacterium sp. SGG-5 TaxID=2710881 RepID=UPI0013EABF06|nr:type II toxin-antitoxin system RelE/ParE family toxin [Sphingobacterium sp. SGG-5]NGM62367.1 type II toxin-antitoxin system RelE/ParE family toxin [Sphingobacterium sp. SGG-5]
MAKYKLTNKAVEDLAKIWNYTFDTWSEKQADKYYDMLLNNCQHIANDPNMGKNYEGVKEELLGLRANRHIIFYRKLSADLIEITRILHERMDLKSRISE